MKRPVCESSAPRILAVDDDPPSLALAQAQLLDAGYRVSVADSGPAALAAVASERPDLILLDVVMPGMGGHEVCTRLKTDADTRQIPILMISALSETAEKVRALDAGADDFVTKPVDRAELLARVRAHLRVASLVEARIRETVELQRAQAILETLPEGFMAIDREWHIRYANRAAADLLPCSPGGFVSKSYCEAVPHCVGRVLEAQLARVMAGGANLDFEAFCPEKRAWLAVRAYPWPEGLVVYFRDITGRKRGERELAERERQLRSLVPKLLGAQEEGRRRVAYEIHDGLAQAAVAVQQQLEAYASRRTPRNPGARAELGRATELARQVVVEARRLIAGLRPIVLDDFGLPAAIELEAEALREDGWQVDYIRELGEHRLPPAVEVALYRVAQEALSNVRKHSMAQVVSICLQRRASGVHLEVRDHGCGFSVANPASDERRGQHVGLASMRERIHLIGGTLSIRSSPGAGTRILVNVPLPPVAAEPNEEAHGNTAAAS